MHSPKRAAVAVAWQESLHLEKARSNALRQPLQINDGEKIDGLELAINRGWST